ncbi:MAG: ATP synthase F0 subunit A [Zetaproteobacteria bacterium CG2_30_46_52]|nr:MAG: ATP synthase F0 subunit A [Zetaproteobacteria bacterium CG2_30_46_52]
MSEQAHGEQEHGSSIADHLEYWIYKVDESNPFMQIHVDTMIVTLTIASLMIGFAIWLRGKIVAGAPTGAQNFVESVVDFINTTVKDNFPVHNPIVAPLAFTIFVFILLCNTIDILPAYLLGHIAHAFGAPAFRPVPTNDLNLPAAMGVSVFILVLYYEFKLKPIHFMQDLIMQPFTNLVPWYLKPVIMPINLVLKLVEEVAKPLSLSFRLFGNMFAGEVIFLLIASLLLVGTVDELLTVGGVITEAIAILVGLAWSLFHMFIGLLQAFIFMILTVVYLSIAHQPVEH